MLLAYMKQNIPPVRQSISQILETSLGQFIEAIRLVCGLLLSINQNKHPWCETTSVRDKLALFEGYSERKLRWTVNKTSNEEKNIITHKKIRTYLSYLST
jgi:hypothetical protein